MNTTQNIIIILLTGLTFSSCSKSNDKVIESELLTYFEDFELEAEARGVNIEISKVDISGYIQNIETRGTLGQCKTYSDGSQEVIIDEQYWNRISSSEKEYLVFHELGHCLLDKEHNDTKDSAGNCISIMQSGNNDCTGIYNSDNRSSLLDQLFSN